MTKPQTISPKLIAASATAVSSYAPADVQHMIERYCSRVNAFLSSQSKNKPSTTKVTKLVPTTNRPYTISDKRAKRVRAYISKLAIIYPNFCKVPNCPSCIRLAHDTTLTKCNHPREHREEWYPHACIQALRDAHKTVTVPKLLEKPESTKQSVPAKPPQVAPVEKMIVDKASATPVPQAAASSEPVVPAAAKKPKKQAKKTTPIATEVVTPGGSFDPDAENFRYKFVYATAVYADGNYDRFVKTLSGLGFVQPSPYANEAWKAVKAKREGLPIRK